MTPRIALYHPEIPQNVGTIIRTCACFDVPLDIIYPIGFVWDEKRIKRSHMDYITHTQIQKHDNLTNFITTHKNKPMIILSSNAETSLFDYQLPDNPIFVFGREGDGIESKDEQIFLDHPESRIMKIPILGRSLNLAVCVGTVLGIIAYQKSRIFHRSL